MVFVKSSNKPLSFISSYVMFDSGLFIDGVGISNIGPVLFILLLDDNSEYSLSIDDRISSFLSSS